MCGNERAKLRDSIRRVKRQPRHVGVVSSGFGRSSVRQNRGEDRR
jgi:hypothetical protein